MQASSEVLTIKDSRGFVWLILAVFFVASIVMVTQGEWGGGLLFTVMSGGIFLWIGPGDITTFEPARATILMNQRSFFRPPILTEIPFDDIASVTVEQYRGSRGRLRGQVVLVDQAGRHIPIPPTGGLLWSENLAVQIGTLLSARGRAVPVVEASARRAVQEGISDGIAWRLETLYPGLNREVTRWFSAAARLPDQFIILSQKPPGMKQFSGNGMVVSTVRTTMLTAHLEPFQLDSSDLPGIDSTQLVEDLEPRLDTHFGTFSSSAEAARAWLTPRVVDILAAWGEQHPTPRVQVLRADELNMLTVLVSPSGLWLMSPNEIKDPARIEELAGLGVALVQAQLETHTRRI